MSKKVKMQTLIVVIILILIAFVYSASKFSTITVYPVFCSDWVNTTPLTFDFSSCQNPQAVPREVYTANISSQQVTESSPDTALVYPLEGCNFVNAQNWSCTGGGSMVGARGYSAGKFVAYGLTGIIFVTEAQWNSINNGAPSPGN